MSFSVIYSDEAKEDIFRNADWWARNHSLAQAKIWLNAIYNQIDSLADMPERCPLAVENDRFDIDIRQFLVGQGARKRYRTIFTVTNDTVHILALLDGAQAELLPDNLPPHDNS